MQTDWTVTERGGVCLVRVLVENPAPVARRVSVSNRLDGPVMPPRREGVPERGWTDDGFEGGVPAEGRLALGYACPAPAARPPVAVEVRGRVDPGDGADSPDATPEAAVRRLGTHAPPADAVPVPSTDAGAGAGADADRPATDPPDDAPQSGPDASPETPDTARADSATAPDTDVDAAGAPDAPTPTDGAVPEDVAAWLAAVETRVDRADRLDGASVAAATAVLREAGGLEAAAALPDRLSADAAALRAVARRADSLADRAESADVPVDALRRLA